MDICVECFEAKPCSCDEFREYWANLTPAERESESQAMADYANQADY